MSQSQSTIIWTPGYRDDEIGRPMQSKYVPIIESSGVTLVVVDRVGSLLQWLKNRNDIGGIIMGQFIPQTRADQEELRKLAPTTDLTDAYRAGIGIAFTLKKPSIYGSQLPDSAVFDGRYTDTPILLMGPDPHQSFARLDTNDPQYGVAYMDPHYKDGEELLAEWIKKFVLKFTP